MMVIFSRLFIAFLLCYSSIIFTQDQSSCSAFVSPNYKHSSRAALRYIGPGGIGYDQGYTTVECFLAPDPEKFRAMPFGDARAHIFNNGKWAGNFGLGVRSIKRSRVYGLNTYYDFRSTNQLSFHQIGLGFETLGKRFDVRANGYIPVGQQRTDPYDVSFSGFSDNSMMIFQRFQFAMSGVNLEFGANFAKSSDFEFYAAAGTYYFNDKCGSSMWGGKGRLVARFKEYITLELSDSYDKIFKNRFQCQLTFSVPLGKKLCNEPMAHDESERDALLYSRMVQPVIKQEIVVLNCIDSCRPAIDPTTNQPYKFVFVDNTSHSAGTYKSPYPTLALAQANSKAGDIIYVFPGDGTTTGMNAGITLKNNQKFWGSGVDHDIRTLQGNFIIPAQTSTSPTITNTNIDSSGDAVTLSSVNEISGFTVSGALNNGIVGSNVSVINISKCNINESVAQAVSVTSSGASGFCSVDNCMFKGNGVFVVQTEFAQTGIVNFTNNTMTDNQNGNSFEFNGPGTLNIKGNTCTGTISSSEVPFAISAASSPLSASIQKNTITNNSVGALQFALNDTDAAQITIHSNTIENNHTGARGVGLGSAIVVLPAGTQGKCTINLTNNTMTDNVGACLYSSNGSFDTLTVTAKNNTCDGNRDCLVLNNPCNTLTFTAKNNTITNGTDNGIGILTQTMDVVNATISNNTIRGNTGQGNGVALTQNGSELNLTMHNNILSEHEGTGLILYSQAGQVTTVVADIQDNKINNNQNLGTNNGAGIVLEQFTNLQATIKNNTMLDNTGYGVYIAADQTDPAICVTMSGNNTNTDYSLTQDTGTFNLAPCNYASLNQGNFNLAGTITTVQSCPAGAACA
jgi:hypothetical protein